MEVTNLLVSERMLLWAIRSWSAHHNDLTAVWWSLDRAFTHERIHAALPCFHRLMSALFAGLKRWPDIRCAVCSQVGCDETRMLSAFAYLQQGNESGAYRALENWVLPSAVRIVCKHALEFVQIASHAGVRFAFPQANVMAQSTGSMSGKNTSPTNDPLLDAPLH
jgi:hypothetical protein